jgi:hypothetical protein
MFSEGSSTKQVPEETSTVRPDMRADGENHLHLFLFIHLTGNLFPIALSPLIFERASYVASTTRWLVKPSCQGVRQCFATSLGRQAGDCFQG